MSKANKASRGLGRGFDVLIPTDFDSSIINDDGSRIKNVLLKKLHANPDQPRRHFDEQELHQLAASISQYGVIQPLIVTAASEPGHYTIIAGERRWRAAAIAGLSEVPVIIRTIKELEKLEIGLIENVQRVDLSPLEQAVSLHKLYNEFNLSYEEIASRIGKAVTTVQNIVRLLKLPPSAQAALHDEKITEGHARAILALKPDVEKQEELLELIIKNGWSVRQAEAYVTACKQGANTKEAAQKRSSEETPETQRLAKVLSAPVSIKRMAKGGRLMIAYKTDEDLERILRHLTATD